MKKLIFISLCTLFVSSTQAQSIIVFEQDKKLIQEALDSINVCRKAAGVKIVTLNNDLSKGCFLHARYVAINNRYNFNLSSHYEIDSLPYATPEGKKAGLNSCIANTMPVAAVRQFIGSFYHRMPLIDPNISEVGIGYYKTQDGYSITLVDARGEYDWKNDTTTRMVVFPGENQQNVPYKFQRERPQPIPDSLSWNAGFPITVYLHRSYNLKDFQFTLKDGLGRVVDCYLGTPQNPFTDFPQTRTVCAIPKKFLMIGDTYTAEFKCTSGSKVIYKKWNFKIEEVLKLQ